MKKLINMLMKKAKTFTMLDWSIFKTCLFVGGLWLATIIPALTKVNARIYGIIFVGTWLYLMWKMFKK